MSEKNWDLCRCGETRILHAPAGGPCRYCLCERFELDERYRADLGTAVRTVWVEGPGAGI